MTNNKRQVSTSILILVIGVLIQCAPTVNYSAINTSRPYKHSNQPMFVYDVGQQIPANSVILGVISTSDTGFSTDCGYNAVIEHIKKKARTVGGDAISILRVQNPDWSSTCYRISAAVISLIDISNWPRAPITEIEARSYLDENRNTIDDIEGIWNINDFGNIRSIQTGERRDINEQNSYRIAIMKESKYPGYEYAAYILESKLREWKEGFLKANFRKTAYSSVYDGLWYMGNFLEDKHNYVIDENGLIRSKYSSSDTLFERSGELTMIKAYPAFSSSNRTAPDKVEGVSGSGFFVSANGILATNAHVIEGAKSIEVCISNNLGSSSYKARVLLSDAKNDVALIQIDDDNFTLYSALPYGFIEKAEPGERVFTIGYPLNDIMGNNYKVTDGIISSRSGIADDIRYLQISVPLQPGNSGGPLFNKSGNVIGLTSARLSSRALGLEIENVNYAIKASYMISLYNMLPNAPKLNSVSQVTAKQLEEQVRVLKNFVCLIKVSK